MSATRRHHIVRELILEPVEGECRAEVVDAMMMMHPDGSPHHSMMACSSVGAAVQITVELKLPAVIRKYKNGELQEERRIGDVDR